MAEGGAPGENGGAGTDASGGSSTGGLGSGGDGDGGAGDGGGAGTGGDTSQTVVDPCEAIVEQQDFCNTLGDVTYTMNGTLEAGCHVFGDLDVAATLKVKADTSTGPTVIIADTITIRMGGDVDASAQGFTAEAGPGAGVTVSAWGTGAGHGGKGADRSGSPGGATYGDPKYPVTHGSGGGAAGGTGGGALLICARSMGKIDGVIRSNGGGATAAGAGAGGSILLIAPALEGSGVLEAKGGTAASSICGGTGASGGGGRIAVLTDKDEFTSVGSGTGMLDVTGGGGCSPAANGSQFVSKLPEGT